MRPRQRMLVSKSEVLSIPVWAGYLPMAIAMRPWQRMLVFGATFWWEKLFFNITEQCEIHAEAVP